MFPPNIRQAMYKAHRSHCSNRAVCGVFDDDLVFDTNFSLRCEAKFQLPGLSILLGLININHKYRVDMSNRIQELQTFDRVLIYISSLNYFFQNRLPLQSSTKRRYAQPMMSIIIFFFCVFNIIIWIKHNTVFLVHFAESSGFVG